MIFKISFFSGVSSKIGEEKSLDTILQEIKTGLCKDKVEQIRSLRAEGSNQEATKVKGTLPAFTPSGIFRDGHRKENLETYVPCVVLDLDNIEADKLAQVKAQVSECKFTLMCFISPSGNGLKILVKTNALQEEHEACFQQVAKYYESLFNVSVDRSGKDFSRLCFMSYDPEVYYNPDSTTWLYSAEQSQTFTEIQVKDWKEVYQGMISFTGNVSDFEPGSRNNFIHLLANNLNRAGVPKENALEFILRDYTQHDFSREEIEATVESAYRNTSEFGVNGIPAQTARSIFDNTPSFPTSVYDRLPKLLKDITDNFNDERERDLILLASLGVFSGIFPTVYGIYGQRKTHSNLYLMVTAPSASGKGVMKYAELLIDRIHQKLLSESQSAIHTHKQEHKGVRNAPPPPPLRLLVLPADITQPAFVDRLFANGGSGILFATEADVVSQQWGKDWSNYSTLLRNAFHHEKISYSRKKDQEHVEVDSPKVSLVLSGTLDQVQRLFHSAENGLFSRFLHYTFMRKNEWRDVFKSQKSFDSIFEEYADQVFNLHEYYQGRETEFCLTKSQQQRLNQLGVHLISKAPDDAFAQSLPLRLGLIFFRMAMLLTCIRHWETGQESIPNLECSDEDFEICHTLIPLLFHHSLRVLSTLPKSSREEVHIGSTVLLEGIPCGVELNNAALRTIAQEAGLNIADRTLRKYLKILEEHGLILRNRHGVYEKRDCN